MKIGLIAGSGQFPVIFAKNAQKKGYCVYTAAYRGEADKTLCDHVDHLEWFHLGQVKRLIRYFHQNGVSTTVMMGGIQKTRLFTDVKPDIKAIALFAKMKNTHDDGILRAFAGVLEKEGITVQSSTFLLPELLAPEGLWTQRKLSKAEKKDIELGWKVAKEIGRLDIGQCVVVGGGSILAVEAVDGTDATIHRGGRLGHGEAVVVKVCKPNQDTRFDIPAVGLQTIETMHLNGARALAVEAGKAVVFNRTELIDAANQYGIAIVAFNDAKNGAIFQN